MIFSFSYWWWCFKDFIKKPNMSDFKIVTGYDLLEDAYYNIKYGILNIITWLPVIWRDRQWDHAYFYKVLHKKLSLMEYQFRVNSHCMNSPKYARRMKICMKLIKRIEEDDYGEHPVDLSKRLVETPLAADDPLVKKHGPLTQVSFNTTAAENEAIKKYFLDFDKSLKKDIEVLFRIMRKNIQHWWD